MSTIVDELLKKPKRDRGYEMPQFVKTYPKNYKHQVDTLYLPTDTSSKNEKYALVVVDVGSRLVDAEPMKQHSASEVIKALTTIYKRKILSKPEKMYFDSGSEFKGAFLPWLKNQGISHRVAKVSRHRQNALAEYKNKIIGKMLFKRMLEEEFLTNEPSTQWVTHLPKVIRDINKKIKGKPVKTRKSLTCVGESCNMLEQGTKVRVQLDAPLDFLSGKRLNGNFRETDIRYDPKIKTITHTLIKVNQPPLYVLDNDESTAYTKKQLLVVKPNELKPRTESILPVGKKKGQDTYKVEKILSHKLNGSKRLYQVKWVGYDKPTWEPRDKLLKDVPSVVNKYESSIKK